jgi:hypothetical protein
MNIGYAEDGEPFQPDLAHKLKHHQHREIIAQELDNEEGKSTILSRKPKILIYSVVVTYVVVILAFFSLISLSKDFRVGLFHFL